MRWECSVNYILDYCEDRNYYITPFNLTRFIFYSQGYAIALLNNVQGLTTESFDIKSNGLLYMREFARSGFNVLRHLNSNDYTICFGYRVLTALSQNNVITAYPDSKNTQHKNYTSIIDKVIKEYGYVHPKNKDGRVIISCPSPFPEKFACIRDAMKRQINTGAETCEISRELMSKDFTLMVSL